ncbi:MAG: glycosyltransferase family 4 protein [Deltaproteobacteria bacterium]|nr:glycosyltransferase family 4 protein [Deltaproteobacteria bacterium]
MSAMRIAFITNEFIRETCTAGGLGSYLGRITRALCEAGHAVEVFVTSNNQSGTAVVNGIPVHRVRVIAADSFVRKALNWVLVRLFKQLWSGPAAYLNNAWHLRRALHAREQQVDFDLVQSTNCGGCGLLIRRKKGRLHVMRMSSKRDLWFAADGKQGAGFAAMSFLEKIAARRADRVYAPSRFLARECTEQWRIHTGVLRPPVFLDAAPADALPFALPGRFMIHFGSFAPRKGSTVLARALETVWEQAPDFAMVWCGSFADSATRQECLRYFGAHAPKIMFAGTLEKDILYAVVQKSVAAVLPSRVDNLPNTVIESLLLGVPVIGTYNSSIDELVQHGITGLLVENNDASALAEALLSVWNGATKFSAFETYADSVCTGMEPRSAVESLVHLRFE